MTDRASSDAARAELVRRYDRARAAGDVEAMAATALELAGLQIFGTVPGRVPAFLYEAYTLASGARRAELAVALARVWAYGGQPQRAVEFAEDALREARARGDSRLLAHALDAQLLVHWGPDDLDERVRITAALEDAVAHLSDVEVRLSAYLWRLTTGLETLDVAGVRRQLRALDQLAGETGSDRVGLFAHSRRGMYALLVDDVPSARACLTAAVSAGQAAGEVDTYAIERTLTAAIARQSADLATLAREAAVFEEFGVAESVTSVAAEAAVLWVAAGETDRAVELLRQLAGNGFADVARDQDWLLSMTCLCEVAVAGDEAALAERAAQLLAPYTGRAVVNGGAVAFAGLVDEFTGRAWQLIGRTAEAQAALSRAELGYRTMGAAWWLRRLPVQRLRGGATAHLHPQGEGLWCVGREGSVRAVRDAKGLHHLRMLLDRPGVDVSALELSGHGPGNTGTGLLADRQALAAYRRRLADIDSELDQAREWADEARVPALQAERDALLAELRRVTGLGGRPRLDGGDAERARVAVRKAIAAAIERVTTLDASLGRLLSDTVSTGGTCRYDPDPDRPTTWRLDGDGPAG